MKFKLALTLLASTGFWCVAGCSSSPSSSADGDGQGGQGGSAGSNNPSGGNGGNPDDGGVDASIADANVVDASTGGTSGGGTTGQLDTTAWGPCQMVPVPAGLNASMAPRKTPAVAPKCLPVGSTVSRVLSLMATSTAAKRHKVKVLFYGQSITKGGWVPATETYLRTTFPYADFEFREEAVGGFWGPLLARTADHDVLPWYPDLMVYHSYGPLDDVLQLVRRRTTAEIMLQTHHSTAENAAGAVSSDRESFIERPALASRLGMHIIDIRGAWKAHLASTGQTAQSLTLDGTHLNDEGNALYAKITNGQLKYDANVIVDPLRMVTTYEVGKDVTWNGNKLTLKFDGNRVDVQAKAGIVHLANAASILIDGKKPSDFVSAYAITRPNREVDEDWPWKKGSVIRITMDPVLVPQIEEWTMKLTSINKAGNCTFTLTGSVTGADGMGTCDSQFTSTSKRMRIAAEDYWFGPPQTLDPPANISVGSEVKWNVYALHADSYPPGMIDASDATKEYPTTIVQGISNGPHTLELTMTGATTPAIEAIRVHRPPLR